MQFFSEAVNVLQTLVIALGAGLAVWGVVNLLEGYGNDNPGAKSQGIKQLMAGGGVVLIGTSLIPFCCRIVFNRWTAFLKKLQRQSMTFLCRLSRAAYLQCSTT